MKNTFLVLVSLLGLVCCGCGGEKKSVIVPVLTGKELSSIIDNSGDTLIAFDNYADWCVPCHVLEPTLEEVARENQKRVDFYKVNVDQVTEAVQTFGIPAVPFVAFVKNKKVVASLTGVQPRESYEKIIKDNSKK
ncbi:MAG TPA: thioredoxin family protein [Chitinivibrionales bacterium]|nr:thioredoxin family protein [Chitinivibrionales bacterium]